MDVLTTYILKYGGQMVGFSVLIPREYMKDPALSSVGSSTAGFITESALLYVSCFVILRCAHSTPLPAFASCAQHTFAYLCIVRATRMCLVHESGGRKASLCLYVGCV